MRVPAQRLIKVIVLGSVAALVGAGSFLVAPLEGAQNQKQILKKKYHKKARRHPFEDGKRFVAIVESDQFKDTTKIEYGYYQQEPDTKYDRVKWELAKKKNGTYFPQKNYQSKKDSTR